MTIWNQAKLKQSKRPHRRSVFAPVGPSAELVNAARDKQLAFSETRRPISDSHACYGCGYLKCSCGTARPPANRALHEARALRAIALVPLSGWKEVHDALDKLQQLPPSWAVRYQDAVWRR